MMRILTTVYFGKQFTTHLKSLIYNTKFTQEKQRFISTKGIYKNVPTQKNVIHISQKFGSSLSVLQQTQCCTIQK